MKVKMSVSIAGHDFSYHPGQEVELEDNLAKAWIATGHCKKVGDPDGAKAGNSTGKRANKPK